MNHLPFTIPGQQLLGSAGAYPIVSDDVLTDALVEGVLQDLGTDLDVTVGEVTMFLSAWRDPDHWSEDWAEELDIDIDDVPQAVVDLLTAALEEA